MDKASGWTAGTNPFSFLSRPAQRALAAEGIEHLEDLTRYKKSDIAELHGMGPSGLARLVDEMKRHSIAFKD